MLGYLRNLSTARGVLWCYLIWYLVVLALYFEPDASLWLSSLGISGIIGAALYLSTAHAGPRRTELGRWQIFRLFLMPFCVSSFAALIKDRGFILVFHPDLRGNLLGLAGCLSLWLLVWLAKHTTQRISIDV